MRRVMFIVGWLLVLALAQISLNSTVGLLAVVACAVHIGLVLGHRGQPHTARLSLGAVLWLACQVVTAPVRLPARLLRRRQRPGQAETIGIEVQLLDRRRSAEIEHHLRAALRQCARTWAPHQLPVDRIAVYAGAPTEGRWTVYKQWLPADDSKQPPVSLTVISLGLLDATGRLLDDQQLVGALENLQTRDLQTVSPSSGAGRPSARDHLDGRNMLLQTTSERDMGRMIDRHHLGHDDTKPPAAAIARVSSASRTARDVTRNASAWPSVVALRRSRWSSVHLPVSCTHARFESACFGRRACPQRRRQRCPSLAA